MKLFLFNCDVTIHQLEQLTCRTGQHIMTTSSVMLLCCLFASANEKTFIVKVQTYIVVESEGLNYWKWVFVTDGEFLVMLMASDRRAWANNRIIQCVIIILQKRYTSRWLKFCDGAWPRSWSLDLALIMSYINSMLLSVKIKNKVQVQSRLQKGKQDCNWTSL